MTFASRDSPRLQLPGTLVCWSAHRLAARVAGAVQKRCRILPLDYIAGRSQCSAFLFRAPITKRFEQLSSDDRSLWFGRQYSIASEDLDDSHLSNAVKPACSKCLSPVSAWVSPSPRMTTNDRQSVKEQFLSGRCSKNSTPR